MSSIIERLNEFCVKNNISVSGLEREIGVANGTLRNAFIKKSDIGAEKIAKILKIYPINANWLLFGEYEQKRIQRIEFNLTSIRSLNMENGKIVIDTI